MYKIRLTKKNTPWSIVQNPIKHNYYSDAVRFRNEADKEAFINKHIGKDWKNLEMYQEVNLVFQDEIHFTFMGDLEDFVDYDGKKLDRTSVLQKDFAIVYDSNEYSYKFYTIQCNFSSGEQVYTTVQFQAELDVFFNYSIKDMWKDNAQCRIERGIPKEQWKGNIPKLSLDSPLSFPEPIQAGNGVVIKEEPKELFGGEPIGWVGLFNIQKYNLDTKLKREDKAGVTAYPFKCLANDLIALGENVVDNKVYPDYILFQNELNGVFYFNYQFGGQREYGYPASERVSIDGSPKIYRKSATTVMLYIPNEKMNTYISVIDRNYQIGDILVSPDCLWKIPVNKEPKKIGKMYLALMHGGNGVTTENVIWRPGNDVVGAAPLEMVEARELMVVDKLEFSEQINFLDGVKNDLNEATFSPNQYAKIYSGQNLFWKLTNSVKQSMIINLEQLDVNGEAQPATINREMVFTIEGNFAKTGISNGIFKLGNLRNNFVMEEVNTIHSFLKTDQAIKQIAENSSSINAQARIQDRQAVLGTVLGAASTISGLSLLGTGISPILTTGVKNIASIVDYNRRMAFKPIAENLRSSGISFGAKDNRKLMLGAIGPPPGGPKTEEPYMDSSDVLSTAGGTAQITSGIGQMVNAANAINTQAANLADSQAGKGQIVTTGSELTKIQTLDKSWLSLRLQKWELPDALKRSVGMFYHQFGYNQNSVPAHPLDFIGNGIRWDYLQTEYTTTFQALKSDFSNRVKGIISTSLALGVRFWLWTPELDSTFEVGEYKYRNIKG